MSEQAYAADKSAKHVWIGLCKAIIDELAKHVWAGLCQLNWCADLIIKLVLPGGAHCLEKYYYSCADKKAWCCYMYV